MPESKAASATKAYGSQTNFDRDVPDFFYVMINGSEYPVGGQETEVSDCFKWESRTDDGLSRLGTPESDEAAIRAARLVFANLNKTDYEPKL